MNPSRLERSGLVVIVLFGALLMIYPMLWMIGSSLKPEQLIFRQLGLWPEQFTFDHYAQGWKGFSKITFATFLTNSAMIAVVSIIGNVLTCSLAAYAFARLRFALKKTWFAIMLISMMLPYHVVLIPHYILFDSIGWVNTYLPLTVPKFLASDSFFIFLMVQFIRTIPGELDQAAWMDGCGPYRLYSAVIFPLLLPAIVTTIIFTFIWTWNDFFSQLIYISDPKMFTVSLALRAFMDATGQSSYGQLFAMSMVTLIPIFIVFVGSQKLLIEGISTTGLKG